MSTNNPSEDKNVPVGWQLPLLDVLTAMARYWWLLVGISFVGCAISYWLSRQKPDIYQARSVAVLLERERPVFDARIMARTMFIAEERQGEGVDLLLPSRPEMYRELLASPPVTVRVMTKMRETDFSEAAVSAFQAGLHVSTTAEGLLTVSYETSDPNRAAEIANLYLDECVAASRMVEKQLITDQAEFFREAAGVATSQLAKAEQQVRSITSQRPVLDAGLESDQTHRIDRELRSQLAALELERETYLATHTERDPVAKVLTKQIDELRQQVESLNTESDYVRYGYNDLRDVRMQLARLDQELISKRDILNVLSVQAAVCELRVDAPPTNIAVLYRAKPPERPSGPRRKRDLMIGCGASFVIAFGLVIVLQQWRQSLAEPMIAARLQELKQEIWLFRRRTQTS
ncbi:MAG: hypothetical protein ACPGXK_07765 [Phycisphaerae bacterium]